MIRFLLTTTLLAVAAFGQTDAVSIPQCINYQGKLADPAGNPLSDTFTMTFRLYEGAVEIWNETQLVTVTNGVFNVLLGSLSPITELPGSGNCSLAVFVRGEQVGSRIPLVSVPYAYGAMEADNADRLDGLHASAFSPAGHTHNYVQSVTASAPLSSSGGQNPHLTLNTALGGDLGGNYPNATVTGLQSRPVAATAPTNGQVLTWNGTAWAPMASGAGSNFWTNAGTYIHPNTPASGNSGIRLYPTGPDSFNLHSRTNATNQYALYGLAATTTGQTGYGVCGRDQQYNVRGILGYGNQNLSVTPKVYPAGVRGEGGTQGDGVFGTATGQYVYGVIGRNRGGNGVGVIGVGNAADTIRWPAVGCGGAFTGETLGVYGFANKWNNAPAGGGYFYHQIPTVGGAQNYCWAAMYTSSGQGYRTYGALPCAGTMDTREGLKTLVSVEMPEPRVEDIGRGRLVNGEARIELDPLYLDCIEISDAAPLEVFVQLRGDCNGVYVTTDKSGFVVRELRDGKSNVEFSYRVSGIRKGASGQRFAHGEGPIATHADSR